VKRLPPALLHPDFCLFWIGGTLSTVGSQFTLVAMAWQVYELTDSPLQVGLLGLGRALPQMALSLYGGVLADAIDRKRLMMLLQLVQCAISASLAALTIAGLITPGFLFAAAVLFALASALETPSRTAVIPNLVPDDDLHSAIALNMTQRSVAMVIGPSLAGIVLAVSGAAPCYVVDAASWFAMLAGLALIARPLQAAAAGAVSLAALNDGVKFVVSQQVILAFMILDFGATFFGSTTALLPVYARDILHVNAFGLGMLYTANSVGAIMAGAVMSGRASIERPGKWVLIGVAVYAVSTIGFGLTRTLWLSLVALAGAGAGNTVSAVLRGVTNQRLTPDHFRGRVAAVNNVFVMGGPQLGQFESGVVAALASPQMSAVTGGLGALLLAGAVAALPKVRDFSLTPSVQAVAPAP
jgi:MFS family permease